MTAERELVKILRLKPSTVLVKYCKIFNMGKTQSKKVQVSGDPQVQILNQLEIHEEVQIQHELKLNIILTLVAIHLLITLYKLYKEHQRRQAIKAAKSVAELTNA